MEYNELKINLSKYSQKLVDKIEKEENLFIICNSTVDGLISGSIIFISVLNLNGQAKIRCYPKNNKDFQVFLDKIKQEQQDFYIFTDFDLEKFQIISNKFDNGKFLFINTDLIVNDDKYNLGVIESASNFVNPWIYLEKTKENAVSTAALAYLLVRNYDRKIDYNSYLPIVSAISKDQIDNKNRELIGLNYEILQTALQLNLIEKKKALTIGDTGSSPITDVLKNNITHFIKEITWNESVSYDIVKRSGVALMNGNRIKTYSDLDEKDSIKILEIIEEVIEKNVVQDYSDFNTSENGHTDAIKGTNDSKLSKSLNKIDKIETDKKRIENKNRIKNLLFNNNYILINEERNSFLKNVRTFSKVLDSCIRNNNEGIGLSVCVGERKDTTEEIKKQVLEQNKLVKKLCMSIFSAKWRFLDDRETIFINGEGIIDEDNEELFTSFLKNSVSFSDRIICLRTLIEEEEEEGEFYRYIITNTPFSKTDFTKIKMKIKEYTSLEVNNKSRYREVNEHTVEIIVSIMQLEDFLSNIKKILLNAKIPPNNN